MRDVREPFARYLRLLGIEGRPSGRDGLERIVLRHLCRVPFENVSKLLLLDREGRGRPLTLAEFLDGIEHRDLGGTCHSSNPYLAELLRELGYDADLLGADMSEPNVHTNIRVRIDSVAYHVDVGYGAPFRKPWRLDAVPHEVRQGDHRYVLDRSGAGDSYEVSHLIREQRRHGYVVHGPPRGVEFFDGTVRESYEPGRTFVSCLRIVRFFEDHAVELSDTTVTRHDERGSRTETLAGMEPLEQIVGRDMAMPRCPVGEAVGILERLTGRPFFGG